MKHITVITVVGATLAGCSNLNLGNLSSLRGTTQQAEITVPDVDVVDGVVEVENSELRPTARPDAAESVAVAAVPDVVKTPESGPLGVTVASLGNPAEPGLWLKTPMVKSQQNGRLSYNGKTTDVVLIPIEGAATAGSRMSLQAFQALGAPLTDLVEVNVAI